jgi:hypothetical protein
LVETTIAKMMAPVSIVLVGATALVKTTALVVIAQAKIALVTIERSNLYLNITIDKVILDRGMGNSGNKTSGWY